MGWSVGGVHALALAARHPARVAAVQLLSTCLPLGEPASYRHLSWLWKLLRWGQLGFPWLNRTTFLWLSRQWARHPDRTIDWFIRLMRAGGAARVTAQPTSGAAARCGRAGLRPPRPGRVRRCAGLVPPAGVSRRRRAGAHCASGTAQADGVWAPGNIPYLAGRLADARLHLLPGQGHMLYLENWPAILDGDARRCWQAARRRSSSRLGPPQPR